MVLLSARSLDPAQIAEVTFTSPDRARDVIEAVSTHGFDFLVPKYAGGRAQKFTDEQRTEIKRSHAPAPLITTCSFPPGVCRSWRTSWWLRGVVDDISREGLCVLLREEGVSFLIGHNVEDLDRS